MTFEISKNIISCLKSNLGARLDSKIIQRFFEVNRNFDYVEVQKQEKVEETKMEIDEVEETVQQEVSVLDFTPQQQTIAVIAALHHYGNTENASLPRAPPIDITKIPIPIAAEIVTQALFAIGQGTPDGGVEHWNSVVNVLNHMIFRVFGVQHYNSFNCNLIQ